MDDQLDWASWYAIRHDDESDDGASEKEKEAEWKRCHVVDEEERWICHVDHATEARLVWMFHLGIEEEEAMEPMEPCSHEVQENP